MQSIFLQGSAIPDPFSFPEPADHIQIFLGAKPEISFDQRVREVHLSLREMIDLDAWAVSPERALPEDEVMPTESQIQAARQNTLNAIYFNEHVHGCYLACRTEDAEALYESVDKVATYLAARQGVRSAITQQKFFLREKNGEFIFQNANGDTPRRTNDGEEISENLRRLIKLSLHFAVAGRCLAGDADAQAYSKAYFIPHMPGLLRSLFQIEDKESIRYKYNSLSKTGVMTLDPSGDAGEAPRVLYFKDDPGVATFDQSHVRIENEREEIVHDGVMDYNIFAHCVMAPMMREAFQRLGEEKVALSLTQHLDIISLCAPGKISRADFIRDWVPSV